jgi:hypothetical protein
MRSIAAATVTLVLTASSTFAQSATFVLAQPDAMTFQAWVVTQHPSPVALPTGFSVKVGAVVPMTVELADIPDAAQVPNLTKFKYVMLGKQLVIVDPMTRQIIYIFGG